MGKAHVRSTIILVGCCLLLAYSLASCDDPRSVPDSGVPDLDASGPRDAGDGDGAAAGDGGPGGCRADADCDDGIACTADSCDVATARCRSFIVPALCPAGSICHPARGCEMGRACAISEDCADEDACTVDERCDPAARVCLVDPLDGDGDGHPPRVCGGGDCDDSNAAIHPDGSEACDGEDGDCDGRVDEGADAACDAREECRGGACTCRAEYAACDGACRDLATDSAHCGSCGHDCRGEGADTCVASACRCGSGPACPAGQACVAGGCADDPFRWVAHFGSSSYGEGRAVASDSLGNVYMVGSLQGVVDFGGGRLSSAGYSDVFVASFVSATAAHRWSRRFGGPWGDVGLSVALDPAGDVYVTGSFQGTVDFGAGPLVSAGAQDIFIASYTGATGAHRWSRRFGSSSRTLEGGESITVDAAGSVYVTGMFAETVDFGGGPRTAEPNGSGFVASFDTATGTHRWSRGWGGSGQGAACAVDSAGNVHVVGWFGGTADFGAGPVTATEYHGVIVSYQSTSGAFRWERTIRAGSAVSVATDAAGDIFVSGECWPGADLGDGAAACSEVARFVASYGGASGAYRWSRVLTSSAYFGEASLSYFSSPRLATDSAGSVYAAGTFEEDVDLGGPSPLMGNPGSSDMFVARYDATSGAHRWSRGYGATRQAFAGGIGANGRDVYVTGSFDGTVDFGAGPSMSRGWSDLFLLALSF